MKHLLLVVLRVADLISGNTVSSPVKMWAGDIAVRGVQVGAINIIDIMEMAKSFNSVEGDGIYNSNCDLNGDKTVNISDVMIIVANFNKTSKDYT